MGKQRQLQPHAERQRVCPESHLPLASALDLWNADSRAQGFSERYIYTRTSVIKNFAWWLENAHGGSPTVEGLNSLTVRSFMGYLREARPEGRFGSTHPNAKKPMRPATLNRQYRDLRTFVNFLLAEGVLPADPLQNIKPPKLAKDQIRPFSQEETASLLAATGNTPCPERNRAILLMLLDTGLRVSELCSLKVEDVQGTGITVIGKGNKRRTVYVGRTARRALNIYLHKYRREAPAADALFVAVGGITVGDALTPTGVYRMIRLLGTAAGVTGPRLSPHTLRHTFAVNFLRNGGHLFSLQQLMGHTDLAVLRRYVALAESDLAQAHRQASPADRMGLR